MTTTTTEQQQLQQELSSVREICRATPGNLDIIDDLDRRARAAGLRWNHREQQYEAAR